MPTVDDCDPIQDAKHAREAAAAVDREMHDDGLRIDFDWLTTQAENHVGGGDFDDGVWWEAGCISFTCDGYQSDPGEPYVTVATDWQVDGEPLPKALVPKTRGQFRRLCELANR
jgi:hypothetical protein